VYNSVSLNIKIRMHAGATERGTLERVLEAIGKETGVTTRILEWQPRRNRLTWLRPDALVEVHAPTKAEQYAVEVKNVDRFETLHLLRAHWPRLAKPPLVIAAPYMTEQLAQRCHDMDLYFADAAGNVYLKGPGLYLYVTGKRRPPDFHAVPVGRILNPAGLRVVFALLCKPDLLNATYRVIAAAAGVALGVIGPVIKELETRRHITPTSAGARVPRRKFLDVQRLVQEWAVAYPMVLRPKLNIRKFRAQRADWTQGVNLHQFHAFWGGEVAANRLLVELVPQIATIYTTDIMTPKRLITEYRLRADADGNTEILDAFWNTEYATTKADVVPPILAYADLSATADGRNLEAAKMIYDQFVEPAFRNHA
jgi:hypothetical protein